MISDAALGRLLPASAVRLYGDLIRALAGVALFLVWAGFAQVYLRMIRLTLTDPSNSDFTIFYFTARMVADGLPMYGESPARYGIAWAADHLGNLNPPHFQILTWPFRWLSYGQALLLWVAVNAAGLALAVRMAVGELAIPVTLRRVVLLGGATLAAAPFTTVAVTSEMTFLLMVPFTAGWIAWRRGRWGRAGAWLGVCVSLKLFLLLLVPWLAWRRHWRALGAMAGTAAALVALGALVFGVEPYRQWTETLGRVGWWWLPMNASWEGLVSRLLAGSARVAPLVPGPAIVKPLALAGGAAICAATLWAARQSDGTVRRRDLALLALFAGAILASPLGWVYYLPLAWGPALAWLQVGAADTDKVSGHSGSWTHAALLAGLALLYVPQEIASAAQPSSLATVTLASAYFWGTALLWLLLIRDLRR
ncbi:MAG TPA: glycosyltransferase family 87 protein [Methylomirabilota bacterium]